MASSKRRNRNSGAFETSVNAEDVADSGFGNSSLTDEQRQHMRDEYQKIEQAKQQFLGIPNQQKRFLVRRTGVEIDLVTTRKEVEDFIQDVAHIESATHWMYGDALAFSLERPWGERGELYEWAAQITGKTRQTMENYAWVSRTFPEISERSEILKYKHYELLAGVENIERRQQLLTSATENNWSTRRLEAEINGRPLPEQSANGNMLINLNRTIRKTGPNRPEKNREALQQIEELRRWLDEAESKISEWLD